MNQASWSLTARSACRTWQANSGTAGPGKRPATMGYSGDFLRKLRPQEYADITTIVPYYQALREFLLSPSW
jgi:hypothetical protein